MSLHRNPGLRILAITAIVASWLSGCVVAGEFPTDTGDPTHSQAPDGGGPDPLAPPTFDDQAAPGEDNSPTSGLPQPPPLGDRPVDPLVAPAREALPAIAIKGRAPKTGYARDEFGSAWTDDVTVEYGHNGCDTRNDILQRDLTDIEFKPGTRDCVVLSGTLVGPYTGQRIDFVRGQQTSSRVQIDHVVALSDAWQKGAQQLSREQRIDFANDPLNLLAVWGPENQSKGASDAATWLPPQRSSWCGYVSRQVLVKQRYQLWMTKAEHAAITNILLGCG